MGKRRGAQGAVAILDLGTREGDDKKRLGDCKMNAPFKPKAFGPVRFSVAEYYRMGEAGIIGPDDRTELIDGEVIEMAPIGSGHAFAVNTLSFRLFEILGREYYCSIQGPLKLGDNSVPQPDLMVLKSPDADYRDKLPEADDVLLLIEVSQATLAFDRGPKLDLYARHAIPEVWIVNLVSSVIESYRDPAQGEYRTRTTHDAASVIHPQQLPGIAISAADILGPKA
jgi:Uma2 family endonuclease